MSFILNDILCSEHVYLKP